MSQGLTKSKACYSHRLLAAARPGREWALWPCHYRNSFPAYHFQGFACQHRAQHARHPHLITMAC